MDEKRKTKINAKSCNGENLEKVKEVQDGGLKQLEMVPPNPSETGANTLAQDTSMLQVMHGDTVEDETAIDDAQRYDDNRPFA